ncbi:HAD family phosphatase [Aquibium sp. A9E412]|uniref:HAD family hydrolase n=1 Tax=Aquibium sp. A9E412 TaxID=2976767 RepID=UPI0025B1828B|nr:HAD family phosphatase [Aquibium sp. A9E412]MDN2566830.1 HAD family phosphatase [Aquibium sp. A9E412]
MPRPDLLILDCDGVLVDSEIIAARVEAEMLGEAGIAITPQELAERYAGLTFRDILIALERETDTPLQASLIERAERLVDERLAREVRAVEGARETILRLGRPLCVCSNSSRARIEAMLGRTGLLPVFEGAVFSARDLSGGQPKPAPDVFLHAAEQLGAEPAHTIVLEDSVHGVTGARAAGMRVVGFTGASHSYPGHADSLTEAGSETVISRWADFPAVVEALSAWSEDG